MVVSDIASSDIVASDIILSDILVSDKISLVVAASDISVEVLHVY